MNAAGRVPPWNQPALPQTAHSIGILFYRFVLFELLTAVDVEELCLSEYNAV
jgi:hypothetical protein